MFVKEKKVFLINFLWDFRPEFTEKVYKQEISESVSVDREILTLKATDKDENDKLIFSFYSAENALSLKTFKLDSITGKCSLRH